MQKGLTWILTLLAAGLFAFIYLYERKVPGSAERKAVPRLFTGLEAGEVRAVEVTFAGGGVVRAERTNGLWTLTKPVYPAQQSAIETFVTNVTQLSRFDRIAQHEVALQGQKAFGLDPARATVLVETATNRVRFEIGGMAPLTNNIYLRLEPSNEVVLTQAEVLRSLPRTTNDWRSADLLPLERLPFDHVQVRLGQRFFELGRNPTNQLWQITKPIPARGDSSEIAALFEHLEKARVGGFVADGAVDLERYGLQTPELELSFTQGANRLFTVEFGAEVPGQTNLVYARLLGHTNIVTVNRGLMEYLQQPYKAFHDPRLITFDPSSLDKIAVQSVEKFSMERQPGGQWLVGDQPPMTADAELLNAFLRTVLSMHILDIAKEVPTDADLEALGLRTPRISYAFYERHTNSAGNVTNVLYSEISFGTNLIDRIYVRRSDETPVYITELAPLMELPHYAVQMHDRRIWNFPTNQAVRVTMTGPAGAKSATRGARGWTADALSSAAIEEAVFRLSELKVVRWVAKGEQAKKIYGITPESQVLEVELKTEAGSDLLRIHFGKEAPRHNVYGMIPGEGEALVFEFPGEIYHLLLQNLPVAK